MKNRNGFTLAETLVVMAVIAIVGTIMVTIFTNSLRGSNKSQILTVLKQNGQSVLGNMDKTIRGADDVICTITPTNTFVVVRNGVYTRYRIISGNNGFIVQDNPVKQAAEDDAEFLQDICNSADRTESTKQTLTDTNVQTGVRVLSGAFNWKKPSGFKAIVTINFVLAPGTGAPAVVAGQVDPMTFQTTIQLR